ncbi:MAG TPA: hypothetical protein VMW65_17855 [Chloroflexota bacterium]|nr:hypothetical protein [Chloroflexota bacterium]
MRRWVNFGITALFLMASITRAGSVNAQATQALASRRESVSAGDVTRSLSPASSPGGLSMTGVQPESGSQLPLASGAAWVRLSVSWSTIEPTQGNFNWGAYDSELQAAHAAGYQVIATIRDNPSWTNTSTNPSDQSYQCRLDPREFAEFQTALQQIVGRYSAPGYDVTAWEIGNEPDNDDATNRYATMSCYGSEPDVYANLLKAVYPVIKGINPANQVIVGGLALDWFDCDLVTPNIPGHVNPNFLSTLLNDRAPFDVMNIHYYPNFRVRWEGYGPDIAGKLQWVRGVLARHNSIAPVIVTESGATSNWYGDSTDWQSRYVAQVYSRAAWTGTGTLIWFNLVDTTGDTDNDGDEYQDTDNDGDTSEIGSDHGLFLWNSTAKPAGLSFKAFANEVSGATSVRALGVTNTGFAPSQVEGYEFRTSLATSKVWTLWTFLDVCASEPNFNGQFGHRGDSARRSCDGSAPVLQHTVQFNQTPIRVLDKLGNSLCDGNCPMSWTVGIDPIYVQLADSGSNGTTATPPNLASDFPNLACYPPRVYLPSISNVSAGGW